MQPDPFTCFDDSRLTPSVAIIGGGISGVTAAIAARKKGARVVIFERNRRLGGRAASINFSAPADPVDVCMRVSFGDSPNLRRLNAELGLEDAFETLSSAPILISTPKKGVETSSLWRLVANAAGGKSHILILKAAMALTRTSFKDAKFLSVCRDLIECAPRYRQYDGSFADLLRELNVSESAVEAFWRGFVLSATAETPELAAASAVVADFVSIFGEGEKKATVLVPNLPLREIYHVRTLASLEKLGVETKFTCKIRKLETIADSTRKRRVVGVWDGETLEKFDKVVLATDAFAARDLLVNSGLTDVVNASRFSDYECGSITTAHLWLDRPLTNERIVALCEGPAQWLFQPRKITPGPTPASDIPSYYCQAVIKASHRLLSDDEFFERGKDALIDRVWRQLQVCFPNQSDVKIVASRTSTALDAVISPSVSTFRLCPPARTVVENLAFAGDWIATGSPPSMESAATSGFMAIDALF